MKVSEFSYDLPEGLIAKRPLERRSGSRLMTVDCGAGDIAHRRFGELPDLLGADDLLVFNDTRVIPARLYGFKPSGGRVEVLLERVLGEGRVLAQLRASKKPQAGGRLLFAMDGGPQQAHGALGQVREGSEQERMASDKAYEGAGQERLSSGEGQVLTVEVVGRDGEFFILRFPAEPPLERVLQRIGHTPLPPYIDRPDSSMDAARYQTVYAAKDGAVAAPTAGLHFDEALLEELARRGVGRAFVTLHVGAGTFQPVRVTEVERHKMHRELMELDEGVCEQVARCKASGGRVVAVGTTSLRALETAALAGVRDAEGRRGGNRDSNANGVKSTNGGSANRDDSSVNGGSTNRDGRNANGGNNDTVSDSKGYQRLAPYQGDTDIFIYPGFQFRVVDALITNFHLPQSTLLMLVSAFAGTDVIRRAYQQAVVEEYRFFSYGDAMLLSR